MQNEIYDLIIIGAGPAGLGASIYASRYKLKHLVVGSEIGGLTGKVNARKIYQERKKRGFTIKQKGNKIVLFTGTKKEDFHENKILDDNRTIKGMPTYQGRVRGKVKIILDSYREGRKFKEGMILVTSMTTPDFVALIKRSKAIVTDEGGLLCHAAIVSRELKKPCIIGTKIATQVLKDGDLVEVDAHKGLVKILK
jgi:pyruvate,water dikinase